MPEYRRTLAIYVLNDNLVFLGAHGISRDEAERLNMRLTLAKEHNAALKPIEFILVPFDIIKADVTEDNPLKEYIESVVAEAIKQNERSS